MEFKITIHIVLYPLLLGKTWHVKIHPFTISKDEQLAISEVVKNIENNFKRRNLNCIPNALNVYLKTKIVLGQSNVQALKFIN